MRIVPNNYALGREEDDDDIDIFKNDGDAVSDGDKRANSTATATNAANVKGNHLGSSTDGDDDNDDDHHHERDDDQEDDNHDDDDGGGTANASDVRTEERNGEQHEKDENK
ncbi:hypothetical protein PCOAH_00006920 [Plasmodium coatneyi]|uniref:Uncharacterized protein n=1 Tax=Plasmodium coatneyi TaxID=208452 RepID=A0A1B1DUD8_9APIC|nr:hypothetical protein PCOAH_00006920 [Plasmodium coatneyi]ANQ06372.1 hypothetical protein PCOAH_00006920 [Plasmodium coatneyi]